MTREKMEARMTDDIDILAWVKATALRALPMSREEMRMEMQTIADRVGAYVEANAI